MAERESMSHPTMTKEEIATEFRRSMAALQECTDGPSSSQLDLEKVTKRLDKRIDRFYLLSLGHSVAIAIVITLWLRG